MHKINSLISELNHSHINLSEGITLYSFIILTPKQSHVKFIKLLNRKTWTVAYVKGKKSVFLKVMEDK